MVSSDLVYKYLDLNIQQLESGAQLRNHTQNSSYMHLKTLKPIAFVISLTALLVLLWVNINALMGKSAPIELSFVSIFLVLFPLWAFTIYYLNQTRPPVGEADANQMNTIQKVRYYLGNPPTWAMIILAGFYGYALYSLFLFMTGGLMDPEYVNGQYQINNHGKITNYTEVEYQVLHRLHLRSVTGFFLAFFSVSTVVLAPWDSH